MSLPSSGAFVYYTPLRPEFARSYGTDFRSFWCCTGTVMENHAKCGELIYTHDAKAVSVNLFIASELKWPERGLALSQRTRFPDENATALVITSAPAEELTLRIRHPFWLAAEQLAVRINGKPVAATSRPGGFAEFTRVWKAGDAVEVDLPMNVRVVRQAQCPGWVSLFYGPILLAGEFGSEGLTQADYVGLYTPVKAMMPMSGAPMIVAADDADIVARIAPEPGRGATFRTRGLVKPGDVTLAPFFRVHFQRYAVYWQLSDQAHWEQRQRELAEAERLERELDARTVDRVRFGEQQPEIDHNLRFENSSIGTGTQGRRWREAPDGGWFSCELKLPPAGAPATLHVLYWGRDEGREFDLQADGKVIATVTLRRAKDDYYGVEDPLDPSVTAGKERITIRFQPKSGQPAGPVYEARMLTVR